MSDPSAGPSLSVLILWSLVGLLFLLLALEALAGVPFPFAAKLLVILGILGTVGFRYRGRRAG